MRMVGGGSGDGRRKGKAPIEIGDDSSTGGVITLSDSDSVESTVAVHNKGSAKLKMVAEDLISGRQDQQVFDKALSQLLSIFPHACPRVASADLASQLKKTSSETALERISNRYAEEGVPKAEKVPQQEPKRGMINT